MDDHKIGEAAGFIWNTLNETGTISLAELKKSPGFTSDEVAAGIGWLSREGKVRFTHKGRRVIISLQETEVFC